MNYPLPRASQECWTKWYNHTIEYGALKNKTILWCAQELPCRFKSEQVKDVIGPHHVFILKLNKQFFYAVIDATETIFTFSSTSPASASSHSLQEGWMPFTSGYFTSSKGPDRLVSNCLSMYR